MFLHLYDFKKRDKTIYDGIHDYCLIEKVNEDQLRLFVNKKKWNTFQVYIFLRRIFNANTNE